jgi:hypothetical protein
MSTPLRGRVGRHANTGAQCQNWVEDQQKVIALLNLIPAADGGPEASITGRVVAGESSDALFKAILRFQKKYFPTQQSGFVDPGSAVLAQMEMLALRLAAAPTAPAAPGQWGEFKSGSVPRALREALADNHFLNQVKVVEILRSTLSNGTVSTSELADLQTVADKSKSIMPRSKTMLELFVKQANEYIEKKGPFKLASKHVDAANLACDFLRRLGRGQWPHLDRDEVGVGMLMRIAYPSSLDQNKSSLCGPAAMLYNMLLDRPWGYARFATDLYEKGAANLVNLSIRPKGDILHYSPPSWKIAPVDWLTLASIRDSENWFLDYDTADAELAGATTPMEMVWWFDRAGYSDMKEDANFVRHQRDTDNMDEASRLFSAGYRVCLLIDDQMIKTEHQAESGSAVLKDRHWVVLRSTIDRSGGNVKMTIYTWGDGHRQVPQSGVLPLDDCLMNYYGYVAAKP